MKFATDMEEQEVPKLYPVNVGVDFVDKCMSLNQGSFKGKALPRGNGHSAHRNTETKTRNNDYIISNKASSKYSFKELTLDIGNTAPETEAQEINNFFSDDISDRLELCDRVPHPPSRSVLKSQHCRAQSAKASLLSSNTQHSEDLSKAFVSKKRPASAHVISASQKETDKPLDPHIWKYDCTEAPRKTVSASDLRANIPEPYVYGYKSGRLLSGKKNSDSLNEQCQVENEVPEEQRYCNLLLLLP